ncbi:hypothetical protein [Rhodoferax aquaticus]|uniref:Uncharacterized protein n=1 Tax=Rhodoferax aquaticus TaxID=2527691 RepID=A0A515ER07_9BURK|nr:hypothetical protein [Rhodoferax aquaticus]QDL55093.1 hypothetical protein EXZ61_13455 [Rhodoferax aquaticus]
MHHAQSAQTLAHAIDLGKQGPWAKILVIRDSLVTSLEVLSAIRQMGATLVREHQLVAFAWVIEPSVLGYTLLCDRYASLHKGLLETPVFDNLAAAVYSVEKTLAEHPRPSCTN